MQKYKTILIILAILAMASFFRLWQLDSIPPGLYPDEAINGNQAISEPGKIFYPENNGREGLFINLIALSFSVLGVSIWSLRIVSAIIGVLTVLGLYLLTKELFNNSTMKQFNNETIALLSSFFLATSFWHINFSRISFRAILVPFILVFSFYFLFRGFRRKKLSDFVIAGIIFGLGFYTYIAFRLAILLLGIILILWWLVYRKQNLQKKFILHTSYFILLIFIIALPMGIYFLQNPNDFISRAAGISIFAQPNPAEAFGESLLKHLAMFNFFGDYNWRHNISGAPILFWPVGILFLIGLFLSIKKCLISFKNKNWTSVFVFCFLFFGFFIMLLPGVLTYEGIPHSLRCIGAIPSTFIFAGLGGEFLYRKIKNLWEFNFPNFSKIFLFFCFILLLFSFVFAEYQRYFVIWAKNPKTKEAFSYDYLEIGNCLNSLPNETKKYVIVNQSGVLVNGIPMPAQTIMFIQQTANKEQKTTYLTTENIDQIQIKKETVIAPMRYDEDLFNQLKILFPRGEIEEENGILIFKINSKFKSQNAK